MQHVALVLTLAASPPPPVSAPSAVVLQSAGPVGFLNANVSLHFQCPALSLSQTNVPFFLSSDSQVLGRPVFAQSVS